MAPPSLSRSPDAPKDPRRSLKRVSDVLAPLDHGQKLRLYKMIRDGSLEEMAEPVARLLVQMLNSRRTEHARRLWTGWFDPLIVRNDAVPRSRVRLAGCLHLTDIGAWWFALSSRMEPLVGRIQDTVARLGQDQPLNDIFASEEAHRWADELRAGSLAILVRLRADPSEAAPVLAEVGGFRAELLKSYGVRHREAAARAEIELLETALKAAPAWHGSPAASLRCDDPVREAQARAERGACSRAGAALFALAELHRRDDPALAGRLYPAFPAPIARDAILGRLLFAAEALQATLQDAFLSAHGPSAPSGGDAVQRLKHVLAWHDAVQTLELDTAGRERSPVHQIFRDIAAVVDDEVVPVLTHRLMALTAHSLPALLIEPVRFVNEFKRQLARRGIAAPGTPWRAGQGEQVAAVFRQVAARGTAEGLKPLSQLAELADLLGFPIDDTAIDAPLIGLVDSALREQRAFDSAEARLIDRVIAATNDEHRRCKWRAAPETVNLLEAAGPFGPARMDQKQAVPG